MAAKVPGLLDCDEALESERQAQGNLDFYFTVKPNFEYWGRKKLWSCKEAVALLLGYKPGLRDWHQIFIWGPGNIPVTSEQYQMMYDLLETEALCPPMDFIKDAQRLGLKVPEELARVVSEMAGKHIRCVIHAGDFRDGVEKTEQRLPAGSPLNDWIGPSDKLQDLEEGPTEIIWENITIKLLANNRISYSLGDKEPFLDRTMAAADLINQRTNSLNKHGEVLAGLARDIKFPPGITLSGSEKKVVGRLRKSLNLLLDCSGGRDPFLPFNEHDGWKPRFNIIDNRSAADERAKQKRVDVPYVEDEYTYEDEGDETDEWIKEQTQSDMTDS